jgi:hypothetical protein
MQSLIRTTIIIVALSGVCLMVMARPLSPQAKDASPSSGSVSGRITVEGTPAANIVVLLMPSDRNPYVEQPVARSTTDTEGKFQLIHIPAGRFYILTLAPTLAPDNVGDFNPQGRVITLTNGESVDGITITLRRGGVITGRVTDANGRPRIQERITLIRLDENGRGQPFYSTNYSIFLTDDRGVYRIYGLPPGHYKVSAGVDTGRNMPRMGQGNTYYSRTFHPGTADEAKANVIEVTTGGEATGIDIPLGRPEKAYTASGRIVDADTGKPVANLRYGYSSVRNEGHTITGLAHGGNADEQGRFRIEGIVPGRYVALVITEGSTELYSDTAAFQITDEDVTNLEIKTHHGSSISGIVVIEGMDSEGFASRLSELQLSTHIRSEQLSLGFGSPLKINSDGSFRVTGLRPGIADFNISDYPRPKGFTLLRVERDGVEQPVGLEIGAGETISGVKLVLTYGTGKIIGFVKIEGGSLPAGMRMIVTAQRTGADNHPQYRPQTDVDERGRFVFEGLLSGEYEISAGALFTGVGRPPTRLRENKQRVTVSNGTETEITLVLEMETKNN